MKSQSTTYPLSPPQRDPATAGQPTPYALKTDVTLTILGLIAAAIIAAFISLQFGFFAALFTLLAWWTWRNPIQSFYLFIVIAPILPMLKIAQTIGTITLAKDVIILTLFARQVAVPLLTKKLPYRRNVVLWPILALAIWVAINTLRADSLTLGILRARDIALYVILYFAVLWLPKTKKFYRETLLYFAASAGIVLALTAWQWFVTPDTAVLRFDPVAAVWIPRVSSILAHPSIYGHYLITLLTLAIALAVHLKNNRWRFAAIIAAVITLIPLYLTYTRAAWIGAVAALAAMGAAVAWTRLRRGFGGQARLRHRVAISRRPVAIAIAALILLTVLAISLTPAGTFLRTTLDPTYASNAERLEFAARLIAPITNTEALLGRGLGDVLQQNFRTVDITGTDVAAGSARAVQLAKDRTLVDNQYLKTFVELGLAGLLIYAWLYWLVAKASWQLVHSQHSHLSAVASAKADDIRKFASLSQRILGLWSLGFLAAFIVQAAFIDIWEIFPTNATFWIIAALVSREMTHQSDKLDEGSISTVGNK